MPFTLAHPAAVLPLRRLWRGGFVALVYGSIGPDIPYFLPLEVFGHVPPATHSLTTALTAATPLALALLALSVLLGPLLAAPLWGRHRAFLERELRPFMRSPWAWIEAVPAVAVGAEIHLACDAMTHSYGWFVMHLPWLRIAVPLVGGRVIPAYVGLQYVGSVAGIWLLGRWYAGEIRAIPEPAARPAAPRWLLVLLFTVAILTGLAAVARTGPPAGAIHGPVYTLTTVAIPTFTVLYLLLGAVIRLRSGEPQAVTPGGARLQPPRARGD